MLKLGFFDSLNGDRKYNARDISEMFTGLFLDGVFMYVGDHFIVKPKEKTEGFTSMLVTVGTGMAWFNHTKVFNTTEMEFEIPQAITSDLTCAIVLEIREADRDGQIFLMEGYDPKKLINNEFTHQYAIATIKIPIGTIDIDVINIENHVGVDIPYVKGPNDYLDDDEIMKHWDATWKKFFEDCNSEFNKQKSDNQNTFDEFIENNQNTFDAQKSDNQNTFDNQKTDNQKTFDEFMDDARDTISEAEQIVAAGAGGIRAAGSVLFEDLPTENVVHGWMFNIINDFYTDERFEEGPGLQCRAGTNVYYTVDNQWALFHTSPLDQEVIDNFYEEIEEVKKSVSDGKKLVADTITDMGVETAADATYKELAEAIKECGKTSGDALSEDVLEGKTYCSAEGRNLTGTMVDNSKKNILIEDIVDLQRFNEEFYLYVEYDILIFTDEGIESFDTPLTLTINHIIYNSSFNVLTNMKDTVDVKLNMEKVGNRLEARYHFKAFPLGGFNSNSTGNISEESCDLSKMTITVTKENKVPITINYDYCYTIKSVIREKAQIKSSFYGIPMSGEEQTVNDLDFKNILKTFITDNIVTNQTNVFKGYLMNSGYYGKENPVFIDQASIFYPYFIGEMILNPYGTTKRRVYFPISNNKTFMINLNKPANARFNLLLSKGISEVNIYNGVDAVETFPL